jgi:predicted aldo/keto reductase-like oxidoreductase
LQRRDFLKLTVAAGVASALVSEPAEAGQTGIPRRKLGSTGERLSVIGLGGIVLVGNDQQGADRIVAEAIDRGVNYFDVAPSYGDGEAEERMGPALESRRDRVFLACKTGKRGKAGAEADLRTSLKRLRTDHLDLYQLHGLVTKDDVEKALRPGGAIEAFQEAREKGLVRFLGFSAHSVEAALAAIDRFRFDTVLFPINWVCWFQGNHGPQVVKKAQDKGMGCLALKAMARTNWPRGAKRDYPKCWYQPISDPHEAALALRFTLSQPVTAALPPGDERLFKVALETVAEFKPITPEELKQLETRSAGIKPIFRYPSV